MPITGLSVDYLCADASSTSQNPKPHFEILNSGSTSVPLSSLTIRYYFTAEGGSTFSFACDYAQLGCGNVNATFGPWAGTNSDHYLEVGFTSGAGSLAPGANTGEVQARFYVGNFVTQTQTNDYSFDPTKTSFASWTHVTLYQSGVLVWGVEP